MASYKVIIKPSVYKDLRILPKATARRVIQNIESLHENPKPRQPIKLAGAEHLYRIRVSNYRIITRLTRK